MSFSRIEPAPVRGVGLPAAGALQLASVRALWARIDLWLARPRSAQRMVVWLAIYLAVAANWPLWNELARIGGAPSAYLPTSAAMAVLVVCATVALLSFTAWSRWMKPLWFAVVLLAAFVQHYMLEYRVVMDPTMIANVLQTDPNEARDLMSWRMAFHVLLVILLPALALWRAHIVPMRFVSKLWRNAALLLLAVVLALVAAVSMNRQLAPLMRNNVHLRYMMNPVASLYSAGSVVLRPMFKRSRKLIPITAGTALGASYAGQARPPMFVLVVGETARADHFGLNGYARNTTPELAARGVQSWHDVHSCSLRCRACSRRWASRATNRAATTTRTWSTCCRPPGWRCCGSTTRPAARTCARAFPTPPPSTASRPRRRARCATARNAWTT
jgi:lipid A ethanolaminephosphotransferase